MSEKNNIEDKIKEISEMIDEGKYKLAEIKANEILENPEGLSPDETAEVQRKIIKIHRKTKRTVRALDLSREVLSRTDISEHEKDKVKSSYVTAIIAAEKKTKTYNFTEAKQICNELLHDSTFNDIEKAKVLSKLVTIAAAEKDYDEAERLIEEAKKLKIGKEIYVLYTQQINIEMEKGNYNKAHNIANYVLQNTKKIEDTPFYQKTRSIVESKFEDLSQLLDFSKEKTTQTNPKDKDNSKERKNNIDKENNTKRKNNIDKENVSVLELVKNASCLEDIVLAMEMAKKENSKSIIEICKKNISKYLKNADITSKEKRILNACYQKLSDKKPYISGEWIEIKSLLLNSKQKDSKNLEEK